MQLHSAGRVLGMVSMLFTYPRNPGGYRCVEMDRGALLLRHRDTQVSLPRFDAECPTEIRCGPESRPCPGGGLGTAAG